MPKSFPTEGFHKPTAPTRPLVHLQVPPGMDAALRGLTREVLRRQPSDLYLFAHRYFESLLAARVAQQASAEGEEAGEPETPFDKTQPNLSESSYTSEFHQSFVREVSRKGEDGSTVKRDEIPREIVHRIHLEDESPKKHVVHNINIELEDDDAQIGETTVKVEVSDDGGKRSEKRRVESHDKKFEEEIMRTRTEHVTVCKSWTVETRVETSESGEVRVRENFKDAEKPHGKTKHSTKPARQFSKEKKPSQTVKDEQKEDRGSREERTKGKPVDDAKKSRKVASKESVDKSFENVDRESSRELIVLERTAAAAHEGIIDESGKKRSQGYRSFTLVDDDGGTVSPKDASERLIDVEKESKREEDDLTKSRKDAEGSTREASPADIGLRKSPEEALQKMEDSLIRLKGLDQKTEVKPASPAGASDKLIETEREAQRAEARGQSAEESTRQADTVLSQSPEIALEKMEKSLIQLKKLEEKSESSSERAKTASPKDVAERLIETETEPGRDVAQARIEADKSALEASADDAVLRQSPEVALQRMEDSLIQLKRLEESDTSQEARTTSPKDAPERNIEAERSSSREGGEVLTRRRRDVGESAGETSSDDAVLSQSPEVALQRMEESLIQLKALEQHEDEPKSSTLQTEASEKSSDPTGEPDTAKDEQEHHRLASPEDALMKMEDSLIRLKETSLVKKTETETEKPEVTEESAKETTAEEVPANTESIDTVSGATAKQERPQSSVKSESGKSNIEDEPKLSEKSESVDMLSDPVTETTETKTESEELTHSTEKKHKIIESVKNVVHEVEEMTSSVLSKIHRKTPEQTASDPEDKESIVVEAEPEKEPEPSSESVATVDEQTVPVTETTSDTESKETSHFSEEKHKIIESVKNVVHEIEEKTSTVLSHVHRKSPDKTISSLDGEDNTVVETKIELDKQAQASTDTKIVEIIEESEKSAKESSEVSHHSEEKHKIIESVKNVVHEIEEKTTSVLSHIHTKSPDKAEVDDPNDKESIIVEAQIEPEPGKVDQMAPDKEASHSQAESKEVIHHSEEKHKVIESVKNVVHEIEEKTSSVLSHLHRKSPEGKGSIDVEAKVDEKKESKDKEGEGELPNRMAPEPPEVASSTQEEKVTESIHDEVAQGETKGSPKRDVMAASSLDVAKEASDPVETSDTEAIHDEVAEDETKVRPKRDVMAAGTLDVAKEASDPVETSDTEAIHDEVAEDETKVRPKRDVMAAGSLDVAKEASDPVEASDTEGNKDGSNEGETSLKTSEVEDKGLPSVHPKETSTVEEGKEGTSPSLKHAHSEEILSSSSVIDVTQDDEDTASEVKDELSVDTVAEGEVVATQAPSSQEDKTTKVIELEQHSSHQGIVHDAVTEKTADQEKPAEGIDTVDSSTSSEEALTKLIKGSEGRQEFDTEDLSHTGKKSESHQAEGSTPPAHVEPPETTSETRVKRSVEETAETADEISAGETTSVLAATTEPEILGKETKKEAHSTKEREEKSGAGSENVVTEHADIEDVFGMKTYPSEDVDISDGSKEPHHDPLEKAVIPAHEDTPEKKEEPLQREASSEDDIKQDTTGKSKDSEDTIGGESSEERVDQQKRISLDEDSSSVSEGTGDRIVPPTVVISRVADVVELTDGEAKIVSQMEKEGLTTDYDDNNAKKEQSPKLRLDYWSEEEAKKFLIGESEHTYNTLKKPVLFYSDLLEARPPDSSDGKSDSTGEPVKDTTEDEPIETPAIEYIVEEQEESSLEKTDSAGPEDSDSKEGPVQFSRVEMDASERENKDRPWLARSQTVEDIFVRQAAGENIPVAPTPPRRRSVPGQVDVMMEMSKATSRVGQSIMVLSGGSRSPAQRADSDEYCISEDAIYIPLRPPGEEPDVVEESDEEPFRIDQPPPTFSYDSDEGEWGAALDEAHKRAQPAVTTVIIERRVPADDSAALGRVTITEITDDEERAMAGEQTAGSSSDSFQDDDIPKQSLEVGSLHSDPSVDQSERGDVKHRPSLADITEENVESVEDAESNANVELRVSLSDGDNLSQRSYVMDSERKWTDDLSNVANKAKDAASGMVRSLFRSSPKPEETSLTAEDSSAFISEDVSLTDTDSREEKRKDDAEKLRDQKSSDRSQSTDEASKKSGKTSSDESDGKARQVEHDVEYREGQKTAKPAPIEANAENQQVVDSSVKTKERVDVEDANKLSRSLSEHDKSKKQKDASTNSSISLPLPDASYEVQEESTSISNLPLPEDSGVRQAEEDTPKDEEEQSSDALKEMPDPSTPSTRSKRSIKEEEEEEVAGGEAAGEDIPDSREAERPEKEGSGPAASSAVHERDDGQTDKKHLADTRVSAKDPSGTGLAGTELASDPKDSMTSVISETLDSVESLPSEMSKNLWSIEDVPLAENLTETGVQVDEQKLPQEEDRLSVTSPGKEAAAIGDEEEAETISVAKETLENLEREIEAAEEKMKATKDEEKPLETSAKIEHSKAGKETREGIRRKLERADEIVVDSLEEVQDKGEGITSSAEEVAAKEAEKISEPLKTLESEITENISEMEHSVEDTVTKGKSEIKQIETHVSESVDKIGTDITEKEKDTEEKAKEKLQESKTGVSKMIGGVAAGISEIKEKIIDSTEHAADQMKHTAADGERKAEEEVAHVKETIKEEAEDVSRTLEDEIEKVKEETEVVSTAIEHEVEKVKEQAEDVSRRLEDGIENVKVEAVDVSTTIDHGIEKVKEEDEDVSTTIEHGVEKVKEEAEGVSTTIEHGIENVKEEAEGVSTSIDHEIGKVKEEAEGVSTSIDHEIGKVKEEAEGVSTTIEHGVKKATEGAEDVTIAMSDRVERASEKLDEEANIAKARISDVAEDVTTTVQHVVEAGKGETEVLLKKTEDEISLVKDELSEDIKTVEEHADSIVSGLKGEVKETVDTLKVRTKTEDDQDAQEKDTTEKPADESEEPEKTDLTVTMKTSKDDTTDELDNSAAEETDGKGDGLEKHRMKRDVTSSHKSEEDKTRQEGEKVPEKTPVADGTIAVRTSIIDQVLDKRKAVSEETSSVSDTLDQESPASPSELKPDAEEQQQRTGERDSEDEGRASEGKDSSQTRRKRHILVRGSTLEETPPSFETIPSESLDNGSSTSLERGDTVVHVTLDEPDEVTHIVPIQLESEESVALGKDSKATETIDLEKQKVSRGTEPEETTEQIAEALRSEVKDLEERLSRLKESTWSLSHAGSDAAKNRSQDNVHASPKTHLEESPSEDVTERTIHVKKSISSAESMSFASRILSTPMGSLREEYSEVKKSTAETTHETILTVDKGVQSGDGSEQRESWQSDGKTAPSDSGTESKVRTTATQVSAPTGIPDDPFDPSESRYTVFQRAKSMDARTEARAISNFSKRKSTDAPAHSKKASSRPTPDKGERKKE